MTEKYASTVATNNATKSSKIANVEDDRIVADPTDHSVKHPLQSGWTMWYEPPQKNRGRVNAEVWENSVKKVLEFDSVEDFWCLFNNLAPPSLLAQGCSYHLFKSGIFPAWEDANNQGGGKWTATYKGQANEIVNDAWLDTVLALIGEMFEDSNEICGAAFGVRKNRCRISIWTRNAENEVARLHIGQKWKSLASINMVIEYQPHQHDARHSRSSPIRM